MQCPLLVGAKSEVAAEAAAGTIEKKSDDDAMSGSSKTASKYTNEAYPYLKSPYEAYPKWKSPGGPVQSSPFAEPKRSPAPDVSLSASDEDPSDEGRDQDHGVHGSG